MKTTLLEINQTNFQFYLLKREDNLIEAHLKIPLEQQPLATEILSLAQKCWNEQVENCCFAFKRANNKDYQINDNIKFIEFHQKDDLIHILAKPEYLMGSSQVRSLQYALNKLLTASQYVNINKILIPYEKVLSNSPTPLEFYYSLTTEVHLNLI